MPDMIDKRDRATLFRASLAQAMAEKVISQAALAGAVGVDRSTISALLAPGTRLPNAQAAADCATALHVSCDWLLGLAGRPEPVAELLAASVTLTEAPRALFDAEIFRWHQEAAGYKIRHVPASPPAMLKLPHLVAWGWWWAERKLDQLIQLYDELYPALRLYLFDAHRVYSSPVTVFGQHLAVIYLGRHYKIGRAHV